MATKAETEAAAKAESDKILTDLTKSVEAAIHLLTHTPTMALNQGDKLVDETVGHLKAALGHVEKLGTPTPPAA